MRSFADPAHRGDGLLVVTEQCSFSGGTERLVDHVHARWPQARIVSSRFSGQPGFGEPPAYAAAVTAIDIRGDRHHFLAPHYTRAMSRADVFEADVVLAFHSNGWALGLRTAPGTPVVAYSVGPHRWLHSDWRTYAGNYRLPARLAAMAALPGLRRHAVRQYDKADRLVANSRYAADALERLTGRRASVVYPGVDAPSATRSAGRHVLLVGRLTAQKRIGQAIEAFRGADERLVVVGDGAQLAQLQETAPPNVRIAGWVTDAEKSELLATASVFLCPSVEEFGMVMAEAHMHGVPVVAPRRGGAVEIVEDGRTGVLVDSLEPDALRSAIRTAAALPRDDDAYAASAARFTATAFTDGIAAELDAATRSTVAAIVASGSVASTDAVADAPEAIAAAQG